ncbi:YadA-like family protein [uncultured Veillonella sp.]|uniref:YadA-like family protein n=1 Tax=uncultured Veillonella sp. TaxID=159268 RepID=UPI002627D8EE|nr:S-layer homology domain-containing protein [uncultured Veillonella sp.]
MTVVLWSIYFDSKEGLSENVETKQIETINCIIFIRWCHFLPSAGHAATVNQGTSNTVIPTDEHAIFVGSYNTMTKTKPEAASNNIAIGEYNSIAEGNFVQTIGNNNKIIDDPNLKGTNGYIVTMGSQNGYSFGKNKRKVSGKYLNLIGFGNSAVGNQVNVIGYNNGFTFEGRETREVTGDDLNIIGNQNSIKANNTSILGNNVVATQSNSVILGDKSTDRAATSVAEANINGIRYGEFKGVGSAEKGVVSVGSENNERQIINVASGEISEKSTDAINGSQLYATNQVLGNVAHSVATILGTKVGEDGTIVNNNIGGTGASNINDAIKAVNDGNQGNSQAIDQLREDTQKDIKANTDLINKNADAIADNKAAIETNAANIADNRNSIASLQQQTNSLDNRMNKVGAGAAALAALHPLDFNADDKWNFAVGYGNYKDANAMAVGAFYRPNEDTMLSVAGSMGNGENMVNAGLSFKVGQSNGVTNSKVALAKDVEELKRIVKAQSAEIAQLRQGQAAGVAGAQVNGAAKNFNDLPKDHWAYGYVKSLADQGLLQGYPDGEFKGDRQLTRYEFAAVVYRALQNGAAIDTNMARAIDEFNPEITRLENLDHSRVDRVAGEDNDRHKIERLRANNKDDKEAGIYRDIYGAKIQK